MRLIFSSRVFSERARWRDVIWKSFFKIYTKKGASDPANGGQDTSITIFSQNNLLVIKPQRLSTIRPYSRNLQKYPEIQRKADKPSQHISKLSKYVGEKRFNSVYLGVIIEKI